MPMRADRSIILHIGVHKTGSSAIQMAFCRNRGRLLGEGVLYAVAGCPSDPAVQYGHHEMVVSLGVV